MKRNSGLKSLSASALERYGDVLCLNAHGRMEGKEKLCIISIQIAIWRKGEMSELRAVVYIIKRRGREQNLVGHAERGMERKDCFCIQRGKNADR